MRQAVLVGLSRGAIYYEPKPLPERDLALMRRMGIEAIYRKQNLSRSHPAHRVYPYLLRHLAIYRPNQVWAADITYIPMARGFVYLIATDFCVEALEEALVNYGPPEIFNTDQGCQFTSMEFTAVLKQHDIRISMDGQGRWWDNVFIERLWQSVKYEEVYLRVYDTVSNARAGLARYFEFYNTRRPHTALDQRTPDDVYFDPLPLAQAA